MKNYTTTNEVLKDEITNFNKKITNGLGKVDTKFICDMTHGILANNSIILSNICRTSTPGIQIKKGVERLERHLDKFNDIESLIDSNYVNLVKNYINPKKLYFVDGGDITKDKNTKFENLGYVLDGSNEHKLAYGYKLFEIDTIDNADQPLSLVSDLYSSNYDKINDSNKELSETNEWLKRIEKVINNYGNGTFVFDRGFDGAILMEKLIKNGSDFIIRARSLTRNVYVNGDKTTISNIAMKCKGKYAYKANIKGKKYNLKVSSFNIVIKSTSAPELKKHLLTLVIVKGYGIDKDNNEAYMALLTSRKVSGKDQVLEVVKNYVSRWKIEENFKFKKQQYGLEGIKVRRFKRIVALNKILSIVMLFNNIINLKAVGKTLRKVIKQARKYISFWLYRLADGIKEIVDFTSRIIVEKLYPKRIPRRRDLFTVCGIRF